MSDLEVEIFLTNAQMKKAQKGDNFQVSTSSLKKEPNVTIVFNSKTAYNRLLRNAKDDKGFRFQGSAYKLLEDVEGQGIFKKARKIAKRGVKLAKKHQVGKKLINFGLDRVEDNTGIEKETVKRGANSIKKGKLMSARDEFNNGVEQYVARKAEQSAIGDGLFQDAKKAVVKKGKQIVKNEVKNVKGVVKKELSAAKEQAKESTKKFLTNAVSTGVPGLVSAATLAAAPEAAWAVPMAAAAASKFVADPINKKIERTIDGMGVKYKKGSQEAKDHMARLRAMRGQGGKKTVPPPCKPCSGGSFRVPGRGLTQPVGNGPHTRLADVNPDILRNKGGVRGGSFRVAGKGVYGGSFMPN